MNTENKFEWTDELVREYVNSLISPLEQIGRGLSNGITGYDTLENFKKSKQQNTIQKDWWIVTWSYTSGGGEAKIKSVKRLSDGEIFSLGDEVTFGGYINFKITSIEISNRYNGIVICNEATEYNINHIEKVNQPLFKTEEGKAIFEGDFYWRVNTDDFAYGHCSAIKEDKSYLVKNFSTKECCIEYIMLNKPVLSVNDVIGILSKECIIKISESNFGRGNDYSDVYVSVMDELKLKELAKSKIEGK